jgi:hypothetical protein
MVSGSDEEGAFSGEADLFLDSLAAATADPVVQGDDYYASLFLFSPDKRTLASMWLSRPMVPEPFYRALCDQQIFADVTVHKFALWTKLD